MVGAGGSGEVAEPLLAPVRQPVLPSVEVFGPLIVRINGTVLGPRDFDGIKPRQVFELLVLARGRPVSKDRLADELWGDGLPANAAATLEKYVSILRRRLAPAQLIETQPSAYRFAVERAELDLDRFDALVERAKDLGPAQSRVLLQMASSLVRGDVVEDDPYVSWAETDRTRYRQRATRACLRTALAAQACRDLDCSHIHAERALVRDPLSEEAYRVLMVTSYAGGHQEDALRYYERCRSALAQELGVEPMAETERLHRLIRGHVDPIELLPPPAWDEIPSAIDLRPPRVPFLGRAQQMAEVTGLLSTALTASRYTLVHLRGASGMGKSRFAEEVAAQVQGARIGKARCSSVESKLPFVPLAMALLGALPVDAPDPLGLLLAELGRHTPETGQVRSLEVLAGVATANGPTVLVLDDLQWADPETITALSYLSHRCRDAPLAILVTFNPLNCGPRDPLSALRPDGVVSLGPLGPAEVDAAGWPGLYEQTQGHPLLVAASLETHANGCEDELSLRLSGWVLERAEEAGEHAQWLLVAGAVLGRRFTPEELAPLIDTEPEDVARQLEALCRQGLLRADDIGFDFTAPLLATILVNSISPARRRLVRERLDHHLLRGSPDEHPSRARAIKPIPMRASTAGRRST